MRTIYIENLLSSFIIVDDERKIILKIHCSCEQFQYHCIHKMGKGMDIKYYATPCLHTARKFQELIDEGYSLKIPNQNKGPMKLTPQIRKAILEVWGTECFHPDCESEGTCIHRLIRGNNGGPYTIINSRPYCSLHHKKIHSMEKGCY